MLQLIGALAILLGLAVVGVWVWLTFFKTGTVGTTTIGKYVTAVLESAQLTTTLGYVEILAHVDAIEASPEAVRACDVISDTLWAAAKAAWKTAQTTSATVTPTVPDIVKVVTVTGQVVEVPTA